MRYIRRSRINHLSKECSDFSNHTSYTRPVSGLFFSDLVFWYPPPILLVMPHLPDSHLVPSLLLAGQTGRGVSTTKSREHGLNVPVNLSWPSLREQRPPHIDVDLSLACTERLSDLYAPTWARKDALRRTRKGCWRDEMCCNGRRQHNDLGGAGLPLLRVDWLRRGKTLLRKLSSAR